MFARAEGRSRLTQADGGGTCPSLAVPHENHHPPPWGWHVTDRAPWSPPTGYPRARMSALPTRDRQRAPDGDLDAVLTAQVLVAWAGETARLGWWRSQLASRYGGLDLFTSLTPGSAHWTVLQAVRAAARRHDAERRGQEGDPDAIVTLFHLGFETDEQVDERLQQHKRSGRSYREVLPGLRDFIVLPDADDDFDEPPFEVELFERSLRGSAAKYVLEPGRRRLPGAPPRGLPDLVQQLLAALVPLTASKPQYPQPYFRRRA